MRPFEPSCGTESLRIYELCEHCERDRATWPKDRGGEDDFSKGCPILAIFGMNGRHEKVIIDDNCELHCAEFVEEGNEIPEIDTETLPLFTEE